MEENSDEKSYGDPTDFVNKQKFGCDYDKITSDTSNSSRDTNDIQQKNTPNMFKFEERAKDDLSDNTFTDKVLVGDGDKNDDTQLGFLFSKFLPDFLDRNKISIV